MKLFVFLVITAIAAVRQKAPTKPVKISPKIEYPSAISKKIYSTDQINIPQKKNDKLIVENNKVKGKDNNLRGFSN